MYAIRFLSEEGPNTELTWLLLIVLGFCLLVIVVGWLTSRRNGGHSEVQHEAHGGHGDDLKAGRKAK